MPQKSIHDTIERKARRAIFEHALFRVENAVILAGRSCWPFSCPTHCLALPWWGAWTWLALGLGAVALIVASALTDQNEPEKAVEQLFREEYNVNGMRDKALKEKLKHAEEYHVQIKQVLAGTEGRHPQRAAAPHHRPDLRLDRLHGAPGPAAGCLSWRPDHPGRPR